MTTIVGVSVYSPGELDAHGERVPVWAPLRDVVVDWVAPWQTSEVPDGSRQSVVVGVQLGSREPVATARDRVVYPYPGGDLYEVDGEPADWRHGPWLNPTAGVVTNCRRVEG